MSEDQPGPCQTTNLSPEEIERRITVLALALTLVLLSIFAFGPYALAWVLCGGKLWP